MIRFKNHVDDTPSPTIDITSMIDVVFLMLLFFMLSTTFVQDNYLNIELPEITQREGTSESVPIIISVDSNSRIYWEQKPVTVEELEARLQGTPKIAETTLLIQADKLTPHGTVVSVFDILRRNNVRHLSIATELKEIVAPAQQGQQP